MKDWLTNLGNGVLQNLLASILLIIAIPLIGGIYAFYTTNPQTALIVVLIILTTINTIMSLALLRHHRSTNKSLRELSYLKQVFPSPTQDRDPLSSQADDEFEITDKHFDESSTPQKLVIRFTNRGSNIIHVKKVKYSDNSLGIPAAAILPSYRKESHGYYLIPFDQSKSEVGPGQDFLVEVCLGQTWKREDVNRAAGKWGYLRLDVVYKDKPVEIFNSI